MADPAAPAAPAVPIAELLEQLCSERRSEQRAACAQALPRLRKDAELRAALRELLRTGAPHARFCAAWLLFRAERPSLRLLPALLDALELADGDLRWEAAQLLVQLGRMHAEVHAVLEHEARGHDSPLRRRMALYALRELAPDRPETEALLLAALDDPSVSVRRAALASCPKLLEPGPHWFERAQQVLEREPDAGARALVPLVFARLAELHPELRERVQAALETLAGGADPELARAARLAQRRLPTPGA